jgi:hypothetical protein
VIERIRKLRPAKARGAIRRRWFEWRRGRLPLEQGPRIVAMNELGDERIDLLKLDVEGAEYDVIPSFDLAALGVRVQRPVVKTTLLRSPTI